jgi:transcriptional regulator GlxA family with amidase domain
MLQAARGDAREPRVRVLLAGLAAGRVRSRCDVAAVASDVGLSVRRLSRLVYRETGASVQRHIQCRRLLHAAHLLSKTFLSVERIAALAGYRDESRLDCCFRSVLGVLPLDLRSYRLREACRRYLRRHDDALFATWVTNRLPALVARGSSGAIAGSDLRPDARFP